MKILLKNRQINVNAYIFLTAGVRKLILVLMRPAFLGLELLLKKIFCSVKIGQFIRHQNIKLSKLRIFFKPLGLAKRSVNKSCSPQKAGCIGTNYFFVASKLADLLDIKMSNYLKRIFF